VEVLLHRLGMAKVVCVGVGWLWDGVRRQGMARRDGFVSKVCVGEGRLGDGVRWDGVRRLGTALLSGGDNLVSMKKSTSGDNIY
jgi:hypothetical protein